MITSPLRDIFRINLDVKKYERVLLFTDRPSEEEIDESDKERRLKLRCLSIFAAEIGKNFCKTVLFHEYPATGSHGAEPPEELWELAFGRKTVEALKKEGLLLPILMKDAKDSDMKRAEDIIRRHKNNAVNCVIALSNYSTSHTSFRDFLTRICGCRYASMPLFDISMLECAMNVDWRALAKRTRGLAREVNKAEFIEVKTLNGSYISFSKRGRRAKSDTGILTRPGSFGNLPAGEVFLAPLEGTAKGRLILEWAPTRRLKSPITLTVKDGYVVDVEGKDEYAEYLRAKLYEKKENRNIAEFGIGTNDHATRPDNILESEKILGTIHIALGDNSSFGGKIKTPFHQDFVFFKPTVKLIHKDGSKNTILKSGRLLCRECI
ncbi:MAG: aminopeptidase [Thermodesulfovibrionales bacterium]|nr:aminopeptidase [Thermodesulfovibrionales bacterium]